MCLHTICLKAPRGLVANRLLCPYCSLISLNPGWEEREGADLGAGRGRAAAARDVEKACW